MLRLVQVAIVAALLCCAGPAGSVSASSDSEQLTNRATLRAAVTKTVSPQHEVESLPGEPAAIKPAADERTSEVVIVLLGVALGVIGMAGFHYTGQWMHRGTQAKEQPDSA